MFQRIGAAAFKKDLSNIIILCESLGNPQAGFPCIHIAGTNGKGSVAHMLAAVLQEHKLKTGIYTSPHYRDFRERIKINGKKISQKYVIGFVHQNRSLIEELRPSFFEITVAMAFSYFKEQMVDFAVIETGLGGRLDSTNVIKPVLSVITNIDYDHQQFLGNTLAEIAREKAGIIKPGVPVVIGERNDETDPVFDSVAKANMSPIYWAQAAFKISLIQYDHNKCYYKVDKKQSWNLSYLESDLAGWYQKENIQTVLQALRVLQDSRILDLRETVILSALKSVKKLTAITGRWEILGHEPLIVADSAHNSHGIRIISKQINSISARKKHFVLGIVQDRPAIDILKYFPKDGLYYFTQPDLPRALKACMLADAAKKVGLQGEVFESVEQAFKAAKSRALPSDFIFVGGSSFVVAEVIH